LLLTNHLPAWAGDSLIIQQRNPLRPSLHVMLHEDEAKLFRKEGFENAKDILAIYLVSNGNTAQIPVAGTYTMEKNTLFYSPLYDLGYNLEFEARFERNGSVVQSRRFKTPPHPQSALQASVEAIYPFADTIPYNALYFHIRFSQPMNENIYAFKSVKVFTDNGEEISNAWRQKSFWLDSGRLLVLMIHPGRVKNGIHYKGPLFNLGAYYTIKVTNEIADINGTKIAEGYSKRYFIAAEDRKTPEVRLDDASLPKHNTLDPVSIVFSEGVDNASVLAGIKLTDQQGNDVPCYIREKRSDNVFNITPLHNWNKGNYQLSLSGSVYDIAGNRLNRLFEITDINQIEADKKITVLKFNVN